MGKTIIKKEFRLLFCEEEIMLENGDLIFVKDEWDIRQAIQESTGNYSHVAIF